MFARWRSRVASHEGGFTLIELVVVLAILGLLIGLAFPRYLGARKKAYKSEADNILQEAKALEWAYYQQYNTFDTTSALANIQLAMPGGAHWAAPACVGSCAAASIDLLMSGTQLPLTNSDSVWVTLSADGSSGSGASF